MVCALITSFVEEKDAVTDFIDLVCSASDVPAGRSLLLCGVKSRYVGWGKAIGSVSRQWRPSTPLLACSTYTSLTQEARATSHRIDDTENTGSIGNYSTLSTSSIICTLILPLLKSPHVCKASSAFSKGNVWLTSGFRSRIPPAKHCKPEGHVSR